MKTETFLKKHGITELRPAQKKAIDSGALEGKNVLVCTPTASGKTLIAELAMLGHIAKRKKCVYVVPLKALASEKHRQFVKRHEGKVGVSTGDLDSADKGLADCDIIIVTAEKLDSLLRHHTPWIRHVGLVVVDEIHLMNDAGRGPTLEILITMLRRLIEPQLIGLSATIGNPAELAEWLNAELVEDDWRPVRLDQGVLVGDTIEF